MASNFVFSVRMLFTGMTTFAARMPNDFNFNVLDYYLMKTSYTIIRIHFQKGFHLMVHRLNSVKDLCINGRNTPKILNFEITR